jgi:hypothetical protein
VAWFALRLNRQGGRDVDTRSSVSSRVLSLVSCVFVAEVIVLWDSSVRRFFVHSSFETVGTVVRLA